MTHSMQPIAKLVDYFGDGNPIIVETFHPKMGRRRSPGRKRASYAYIRKLSRAGVTHVALSPASQPNRVADFSTAELLVLR